MDTVLGMRVFVRIVELGGFSAAARALDLSPTMATKHLQALEARLRTRLLHRSTRRLSTTEVGRAYYERCVELLAGFDEAEQMAHGQSTEPQGELRLSAPTEFGFAHLAPIVLEYLRRHPATTVHLDCGNRVVDLIEEGYDLVVRVAQTMDSRLVARPLARSRLRVVAAPAYLAQTGRPAAPEDVASHTCLCFAVPQPWKRWAFEHGGERVEIDVPVRLQSSSSETLRRAALAGAGVSLLPTFLVGDDVRAGTLVDLFPAMEHGHLTVTALYPTRRFVSPKVRSMVELLIERYGGDARIDPWM